MSSGSRTPPARLGVVAASVTVLLLVTPAHDASALEPAPLPLLPLPLPLPAAPDTAAAGSTLGATDRGRDAAPWVWPTGDRVVSRPWDAPADDYSAGHRGLDVDVPIGREAAAVDDGTVTFAGSVAGRGVVTIDHGAGLRSTLDSVTPTVATGDTVAQGDTVGRVAVGHCPASAPCLHVGARLGERYVDPTPYLPAAEWPVLLPEDAWTG